MTDDIGVSIVKQNFGTFKDATSNPKTSLVEGEFKYIENIPKEKLLCIAGKSVFIDPWSL